MKRNLFAILLALTLVVALAFVVAPTAQAADEPIKATGNSLPEGFDFDKDILDLNGQNVTVAVPDGKTLNVINTSFITGSSLLLDGKHPGSLTATGDVATVTTDGNFQYLAVKDGNTYTFHPFNLGISRLGLNTIGKDGENPAVCVEVMFIANDVVRDKLEADGSDYGLNKLSGENQGFISAKNNDDDDDNYLFNGANGVKAYYDLSGSLTNYIDETYEFQACIKFEGIDEPITNNPVEVTPREVLKSINKGIALNEGEDKITPSSAQKDRIVALMSTNVRVSNIFRCYAEGSSATITFDDTSKRSDDKKVWTENDVVVTYDGSTNDYYNPVRFYKSSTVTIAYNGMKQIVFNCNTAAYATSLANSIGNTATKADKVVTVTLDGDSYSVTLSDGQVRVDSIEVVTGTPCTHEATSTATCSTPAVCLDCDETLAGTEADCVDSDGNGSCDSCGNPVDPTPDTTLTIEQAIALGSTKESNNYTDGKYYVEGTITEVYNTQYGNMYIEDENGNTLTIYGTYSADGKTGYSAMSVKPVAGDKVTVYGIIGQYYGTAQMKDGWITATTVGHDHDYSDVTCTADSICTICGATGELATGHSTDSGTCEYCGEVIGGTTESTTVTFNLGTNGNASHNDGKDASTYSETVDGYTLNITGGTKMYTGALDAKGNSCIKFGTKSVAGTFSLTVPENVTKVVIYVAKYKSNTTKVSVNSTTYTISCASDNGEYDAIEVDTSSTKTITFTTVSGGYRAMMNTIEFVIG